MTIVKEDGGRFGDADVARCYAHRPPYPPALYALLEEIAPARRAALDLGCGPGKIALELATRFERVDAVDPSAEMLAVARTTPSAVRFIEATAEEAPLEGPYDVVTLGASVHWMDHGRLFPRLAGAMSEGGVVAVVDGDAVRGCAWDEDYRELVKRWLARLGRTYDDAGYTRDMTAHEAFLDVRGRRELIHEHRQSPADFVECQHSRASWARARMGALADEMDAEMHALLAPHVEPDGMLRLVVPTRVVWGTPRLTPR